MSELEQIKQQKIAQMQQEQKLLQQIQQLEALVKTRMTKEAVQRYGNIRAANPELSIQVLALLGQMLQSGKVDMIDEAKFKEIMFTITPKKKEFKMTRK
jgi:DNA-binding TFAR19-related protein (PDSD5 family)